MNDYYFVVFPPELRDQVAELVPGLGIGRETLDGRLLSSHQNIPFTWEQETSLIELGVELVHCGDAARLAEILPAGRDDE